MDAIPISLEVHPLLNSVLLMRFHILLVAIFATAASASDDQDREGRLDKLTFMHWNNKLPESEIASRKCIAV